LIASHTKAELASALAKAQAELKNPGFDSNNPHFKSKYASLASVRDTVTPILAKHGLSVVQCPVFEDGKAGCETMLLHTSGEYLSERLLIPVDKANAHGVGSCITYSRRFSLMAFAGVVGDEDDDGNAAVGDPKGKPKAAYAATITPTEGCWEGVPSERHEFLRRMAAAVADYAEESGIEDAYKYLYVENVDAKTITNDEFVCVWDALKGHSKVRNAIKKLRTERVTKPAEVA
jgi:hypothetical protein